MGMYIHLLLLQYLVSNFMCNALAFVEEPTDKHAKSDGYCGRILRAQTQGTRRDGYNEFRLRVEGDPENYQPASIYRGMQLEHSLLTVTCLTFVIPTKLKWL